MTKFTTFGILDEAVKNLIEDIVADTSLQLTTEELTDFFYELGAETFCRGEFVAISEDIIPYLQSKREYPPCFHAQVIGNKFKGLIAMGVKLLKTFPQTTNALQVLYDSFVVDTLTINDDFFKIEASVRSGLNDYTKKHPDYKCELYRFEEYYLEEYNRRLAAARNPELKEKIQAHINFIKEAVVLPIYSPKTISHNPQQKRSLSDVHLTPLLPAAAAAEQPRSKSLDDKPTNVSSTLFSSFRRKSQGGKDTKSDSLLPPADPSRVNTL